MGYFHFYLCFWKKIFFNSPFSFQNHNSVLKTMKFIPDIVHRPSNNWEYWEHFWVQWSLSLSKCSHTKPFLKIMLFFIVAVKGKHKTAWLIYHLLGWITTTLQALCNQKMYICLDPGLFYEMFEGINFFYHAVSLTAL